ncbi:MAG TPA: methyltransferase domain-containing protein, partial [Candidatus Thalassarchaeaceae archaeon]|nr:methyltransferase domain-containing protein [Candidatus Thalassarchaeaceae archaeon]
MDSEHIGDPEWSELQDNLEATIPVYDRINRFATLGQDQRWRKGVRALIPANSSVLEIGCGPGTFAERIESCQVTCLDPITAMLEVARGRVNKARSKRGENDAHFVEGTAEEIPLPDNTFDVVCCLFSFRDFQNKRKGLVEMMRVLKPGGQLLICDAGKANFLHGWLGWLWMKIWVGTYARVVCKQSNHPWKWLTKT